MSDAREHEHNWPQRGTLMRNPEHADIAGASNFTTATTGAWQTITANAKTLQIAITPDADCRIEVVLRIAASHSAADAAYNVGVDVNGAITGRSVAPTNGAAAEILSIAPVICEFAATAGTTYTITGKAINYKAGTLTIYNTGDVTELYIKVFKKP